MKVEKKAQKSLENGIVKKSDTAFSCHLLSYHDRFGILQGAFFMFHFSYFFHLPHNTHYVVKALFKGR